MRVPAGVTTAYPAPQGVWPHVSAWGRGEWAAWMTAGGASAEEVERYWAVREGYGVGVRRDGVTTWLYVPTPRQVAFHAATAANVLFGGAVGGAKSMALRWEAYRRCLAVPGYRALLFRRTFGELQDNHIDEAVREVAQMQALGLAVTYAKDEKRVVIDHGGGRTSWLRFAHCEHAGDELRYLSSQYELLELDELATFLQSQAMEILSRARTTQAGMTAMVRCASNPGGAQTQWVVDWFVNHTVTPEQDPTYDPADWAFLPSRLYDNPYLMDPDGTYRRYERRLGGVGAVRRKQLLEGDWTAVVGAVFEEWGPQHVLDRGQPTSVEYFGSMDWGWNAFGCLLLWACLPDGHLHVVREWKFRQLTADQFASKLLAMCATMSLPRLRYLACDPAMNQKTGAGRGESVLETLRRRGLPVRPSDNDRAQGAQRIHALLAPAPDGTPWLTVDPSCAYLRRSVPALVQSREDPDEVDTTGDDHGYDALRYGAMSRPSPTAVPVATGYPVNSWGWWEQHDARTRSGRVRA